MGAGGGWIVFPSTGCGLRHRCTWLVPSMGNMGKPFNVLTVPRGSRCDSVCLPLLHLLYGRSSLDGTGGD